jgi:hypothetical protein
VLEGRRRTDFWPLVILSTILLAAILLAVIPGKDALPMLAYLPFLGILAGILYAKGIRSVDPDFPPSLFWLAFVWKLIGSVTYYWVLSTVYQGGDAESYHEYGQYVAQFLRRFDLSSLRGYSIGGQGSTNMVYLVGFLYSLLPPSLPAGGAAFATLSFAGSVLFYRAFRVVSPDSESGFYRLVVFFLPSLLFWPSVLGKEAWILFASGFVAYGLAEYARQSRLLGAVLTILGLLMVNMARPHFAAFMVLAIGVAYLLSFRTGSIRRLFAWLVGAGILIGLGFYLLQSAGEFLRLGDLSDVSGETLAEYYEFRQQFSSGGGSGYAPRTVLSPAGPIYAVVTVLFRPFPWEVNSFQTMASALESGLWLALIVFRRRVLWARLRSIRREPFVAFTLGYSIAMIMALTTMGNFGIIARQRVTFLPFLWVLAG